MTYKKLIPLFLIPVLFLIAFFLFRNFNYLNYYQHIESPDEQFYYALYSDFSIGDPGFLVLKLEKNTNPKEFKITYNIKNGITDNDSEWLTQKTILSNYDEAGQYMSNPNIKIHNEKYLVFSRGGYMFGLYDLELQKEIFNESSPWHEWRSQNTLINQTEYGPWIEENIHNKIKDYIEQTENLNL